MTQVHKETLEKVDNAIAGRQAPDLEIFGVEGIPEVDVQAHRQRIIAQYDAESATNPQQQQNGQLKPVESKKKKIDEDPVDVLRRLREHKEARLKEQHSGAIADSPLQGEYGSPTAFGQGSPVAPNQYVGLTLQTHAQARSHSSCSGHFGPLLHPYSYNINVCMHMFTLVELN